jgi:hypothetical protein
MKHKIDELLEIVYRYYPRAIDSSDSPSKGDETNEQRRLVNARRNAAQDKRWHDMLGRISDYFSGMVMNHSLHLPTGDFDACYLFTLSLPNSPDDRTLWFGVSFLAPYYVVCRSRLVDVAKLIDGYSIPYHGICFFIQGRSISPELASWIHDENVNHALVKEQDVSFDLTKDEQAYAEWIVREIESTFECEYMPPEIGTQVIAEVKTNHRDVGEARLYDCLFTDEHAWVKPPQSDDKARLQIDAARLPTSITHVLTVLAAFHHIALQWIGAGHGSVFYAAMTDCVLRKDELLKSIERLHGMDASNVHSDFIAALREFETLIVAWNGEGAPPVALIAWATNFLARLSNDEFANA